MNSSETLKVNKIDATSTIEYRMILSNTKKEDCKKISEVLKREIEKNIDIFVKKHDKEKTVTCSYYLNIKCE